MTKPFFNLFGFSIIKGDREEIATSVVTPDIEDGQIITSQMGGHNVLGNTYMLAFDQDGQIKNEIDLIRRYREIARFPEISEAINDIVNEAIVVDDSENSLKLNLDQLKVSDVLKRKILAEFELILSKLNFREEGHEIFEKWYIDGKIFIHIILDENTKNGITELRFIDPRKIKKVKNLIKGTVQYGVDVIKEVQEYYLYNDKGIADITTNGVRLSPDQIVYCHSGLVDGQTGLVQSHIHKAIRPANQLKMLEEAVVIYRYTRAPERRVFYIDVGNLPKAKAEQYVNEMMNKFKNKLQYDVVTGEVADSKRHMCLDMNTRVPLLDGRVLTISEISAEMEMKPTNSLWAYSCDPITGVFAPGLVTWAGVARKNAQVMRLTLDNEETITCTPDHKFPVWDKGLMCAGDMSVGESLIPHHNKKALLDPVEVMREKLSRKITKIELLDDLMDTGCLTIDGAEEFHNFHTFALEAGVYTQNSMMEDFWMPRRGDKSTEISTLPGGQGLGDLSDLDYFKDKLYRSLNVPKSRFAQDTGFQIGRSDTVSRDEIKFQKFISKLRNKFQNIFLDILRVQLISRGVFTNKDWEQCKSNLRIEFNKDNHFTELKDNEILNTRIQTALQLDPFVGKYISKAYIQKNIMKFTDLEIKDMQKQIDLELDSAPEETDATPTE